VHALDAVGDRIVRQILCFPLLAGTAQQQLREVPAGDIVTELDSLAQKMLGVLAAPETVEEDREVTPRVRIAAGDRSAKGLLSLSLSAALSGEDLAEALERVGARAAQREGRVHRGGLPRLLLDGRVLHLDRLEGFTDHPLSFTQA